MIDKIVLMFSELAINERIKYGSFIYELIKYNLYFPEILRTLDKSDVTYNKIIISAENQMLHLFDKLVEKFDKYFPLQYGQRYNIIGKILGLQVTADYLHCKHYYNDKEYEKYFEDKIRVIFISVFINNLKYNYELYENIFKDRRINLKRFDINNPNQAKKVLSLLSDLAYCNLTNDILWLFDSIEMHIIRDENSLYRRKNKSKEDMKNRIITTNNNYIIKIIDNYNKRKDYLKYFK